MTGKVTPSSAKARISLQKARELGKVLCQSIQKMHFPEQDAYRDAFKALMKRIVESQQKEWTFEYEYWQARNK